MCGIAVTHDGENILSIRGDKDDPFSQGHVCPKATALQDLYEDPDRLKRPLVKTAGGWREASWDEALGVAADGIARVRERHGRHSVAFYQGNPTVHSLGAMLYGQLLGRVLRTRNHYSATSVDQLPAMLASLKLYGNQLLIPVPDVDRTDYFLMLGANPLVSGGSLMTAPGMRHRLRALKERGGKLVVVDPRLTRTAQQADLHLAIRPGTDAAFLAAMINVLVEEQLVDLGRLERFVDGVGDISDAMWQFTPARVASFCGLDAERIVEVARAFAAAPSAVCYGRFGACTQEFGGLTAYLVNVVNILTGNLDREGGAMFTLPAFDLVDLTAKAGMRGSFDRYRSRVRELPEFGGELPSSTLLDEMVTPGEHQVRALITHAGNPVLSLPGGGGLESALDELEFMVAIDFFLNETTRHADVILPPTMLFERPHYDLIFHVLAVRNTAKLVPPLFERSDEQRHDWEIFSALASGIAKRDRRASMKNKLATRAAVAAMRALGPRRLVDAALRAGPYGLGKGGLCAGKLEDQAHGMDLGALKPVLPERLGTKSGEIRLDEEIYLADLGRLSAALTAHSPGEETPLVLIGRRELRSCNSWLHNSARLTKGDDPCTLLMHPDDAGARGLATGDEVLVRGGERAVRVPLEVTGDIRPGVVSLPHGFGHHREGTRLGVASKSPGASVNDITDRFRVDPLSGTASFSAQPVSVQRSEA